MTGPLTTKQLINRTIGSLCSLHLAGIFLLSSFFSFSQTISIGAPVDGYESVSNASFTIYIEGGGVNTTGNPINGLINYSGSAVYGSDFTGAVSFSIPNGVDSVQISINIIDDNRLEFDDTIVATISDLSTGAIGNNTSLAVIIDEDLPQLQISIVNLPDVIEGLGGAATYIFIEGNKVNDTGISITGDITYSGTGTNGSDYTGESTFTIFYSSTIYNFYFVVINDAILESPETVTLTISNLNMGSALNASTTFTIFDDESNETYVSIGSASSYYSLEGSSDATLKVFIADGGVNTTGAPITGTINYSGDAIHGIDFTAPVSFSIPIGESADTLDVIVLDDMIPETTEDFITTISNLNIGVIVNSSVSKAIQDDDAQSIILSIGSPVNGIEGTSDVSFEIYIEGGIVNNSDMPIEGMIFYDITSTALNGADFAGVNNFIIPIGASSTTVTIPVYDDHMLEPVETIDPILSSTNLGYINNAHSTAEILDDDSDQYVATISSLNIGAEAGGDITMVISLENGMINSTGAPITGSLNFSGTVNPSMDLSNLPSSFSIPDGANSTSFTIGVLDDDFFECDEFVYTIISDLSVGSIGFDTDTALVVDDECAVGTISISAIMNGEEAGSNVHFRVSFENDIANGTGSPITGTLDLSGGTAIPGVDFVDQQSFQIINGSTLANIFVTVIDDPEFEDPLESVVATISNLSFASIGTASATGFILDNETVSNVPSVVSNHLEMYPNPAESILTINSEDQVIHCSIFDVNGREVYAKNIVSKSVKLHLDFLNAGAYFVQLVLENGTIVNEKLIKL